MLKALFNKIVKNKPLQKSFTSKIRHPQINNFVVSEWQTIKQILQDNNFNDLMNLYKTILTQDVRIKGDMLFLQKNIANLDYEIVGDNADIVNSWLNYIDFNDLIFDLCNAIPYGFCFINWVWSNENSDYFLPLKFNYIDPILIHEDSMFDDKKLYVNSHDNEHIYIQNNKKIISHFSKATSSIDIKEYGIMKNLCLIYAIKRGLIVNLNIRSELEATPPIIANTSSHANDEAKDDIMNGLVSFKEYGVGLFDANTIVKMIEPGSSSESVYKSIAYLDAEMSYVIKGSQTRNAMAATGSYAIGEVNKEEFEICNSYHVKNIEQTINSMIEEIFRLNNIAVNTAPRFNFIKNIDVNKAKALKDLEIVLTDEEKNRVKNSILGLKNNL